MPGLLGKKIGMTSVFSAEGVNMPCTVIEVGPCVVTQIKTVETDGYAAVQVGFLAEFERRKDRKGYTTTLEEALKEELTPVLWKMTRYEGVILLKLLDRETKNTAFNIVKNIRSGFTANFYQILARMFGNNLKLEYDPTGEDAMMEQIVLYYKAGLL